jgi:hypothetical protein
MTTIAAAVFDERKKLLAEIEAVQSALTALFETQSSESAKVLRSVVDRLRATLSAMPKQTLRDLDLLYRCPGCLVSFTIREGHMCEWLSVEARSS